MNKSVYTRPHKPLFNAVPTRTQQLIIAAELPAPVIVDRGTECHVTPPDVAARMAAMLGDLHGKRVLEPSAGTGNLARAVLAAGCHRDNLLMIEMHAQLAALLKPLGPTQHRDFLDFAKTKPTFPAIIMNPPFSRVRAHIAAALGILAPRGILVALVPVTFDASDYETLETLPETTFAAAKVRTKIIRR
jgi:protein-L-isoaspartate O-methyltransferase